MRSISPHEKTCYHHIEFPSYKGVKLEAGNFGKHDERNRFGRSKLGHNLQRVYRDMRLMRYFPGEALCEPLFRIWHFFEHLPSIVFTPPSVPLVGDRNLRRKDATALRCSELLRSKVGGASKPFAILCGMGPLGNSSLQLIVYS